MAFQGAKMMAQGTKMLPQSAKMDPPSDLNDKFGCPKPNHQSASPANPTSPANPSNPANPNHNEEKGPAAEGVALKICPTSLVQNRSFLLKIRFLMTK